MEWLKINQLLINSVKLILCITDFKNEINVSYSGVVPNLFEEGKGVVAEGFLKDSKFFDCEKNFSKT